jgi:hypothetical protein
MTRGTSPIFEEAIASGVINPGMTRAEAEALMPRLMPLGDPRPRPETVAVDVRVVDDGDKSPIQTWVGIREPEEESRPDQMPPGKDEHCFERTTAEDLAGLAEMIGLCDIAVLAALLRDKPEWLEGTQRAARLIAELLELARGDAGGGRH